MGSGLEALQEQARQQVVPEVIYLVQVIALMARRQCAAGVRQVCGRAVLQATREASRLCPVRTGFLLYPCCLDHLLTC